MTHTFNLNQAFPFLKTADPFIHGVFGLMAILFVLLRVFRSISLTEPDVTKRRSFMALCLMSAVVSFVVLPLLVSVGLSSMRNKDMGFLFHWSVSNWHQAYLMYLVPLALFIAGFSKASQSDTHDSLDTVALHLPLGLLIVQAGFLMTGTAWGRTISLYSLGIHQRIASPLPLYAMFLNLILYFFLKRVHTRVHASPETKTRYRGTVWGVYALMFGSGVQLLDHYGKESRVLFKLTLTQMLMTVFVLAGTVCLVRIFFVKNKSQVPVSTDTEASIRRLIYIAGFVAMTFIMIFMVYYMIRHMHIISWPFRKTQSLSDAYSRILQYLPMMALPAIAFLWMKRSRIPLRDAFAWKRVSRWFYPALVASIGYGLYKLLGKSSLKGLEYWPPVLILSTMNALSEEYSYRFVFFRLLRQAEYSRLVSQTGQAALYALPHFMLAGLMFGIMSFFYGLLLGILADRNESITPAVICHFIIDIGCIGHPLLRI